MLNFFEKSYRFAKYAFALVAAANTTIANASYYCNAQVTSVLVYADGGVNVLHSGRGDYTFICNLNTSYKSVTTEACAGWLGIVLLAKKNNAALQFYYDGSGTCSTLLTYSNSPAPSYIGPVN